MHTAEEPEEEPKEVTTTPRVALEDLDYLDPLVALGCRSPPISVQEKAFGVIGAYLKENS